MTAVEHIGLLVLGLAAGVIGGLVGVGGSLVIIPVLTLLLGTNQHLSQAAAMIVNLFVTAPALVRHEQADLVRWDVVGRMLPFGLVFILVGVEASNYIDGDALKKIYGAFLLYVIAFNLSKLLEERRPRTDPIPPRLGWGRVGVAGGAMGLAAGLLGIGGAPVAQPLLQRLSHLPFRQAIACTSAVMCLTSVIGAAGKNLTLGALTGPGGEPLGLRIQDSLVIAAWLAPTAVVGSVIGAGLTHTLPVRWVRLAFILLMVWASANMLGAIKMH